MATSGAFSPAYWAVVSFFFSSGFTYALWGINIPALSSKFNLDPLRLSLALFAVALGAIITMAPVGRLITRKGSARVCQLGLVFLALSASLIFVIPSYELSLVALVLFGSTNSIFDTAMNAQAVALEEKSGKSLLSFMHGMFSTGGIAGALVGSIWLDLRLPVWWIFDLVGLLLIILFFLTRNRLLQKRRSEGQFQQQSSGNNPSKLITIGLLAFLGLTVEGAMYDWTSIFMRDIVHANGLWMGAGYSGFCIGMMIGRFTGDTCRTSWSDVLVIQLSGLTAFLGLSIALWRPFYNSEILGFLLTGLGSANFIPILFSAGARHIGISVGDGIAFVSCLGYFGFLFGPVMVGLIASRAGLLTGLYVIAMLPLLIALNSKAALH